MAAAFPRGRVTAREAHGDGAAGRRGSPAALTPRIRESVAETHRERRCGGGRPRGPGPGLDLAPHGQLCGRHLCPQRVPWEGGVQSPSPEFPSGFCRRRVPGGPPPPRPSGAPSAGTLILGFQGVPVPVLSPRRGETGRPCSPYAEEACVIGARTPFPSSGLSMRTQARFLSKRRPFSNRHRLDTATVSYRAAQWSAPPWEAGSLRPGAVVCAGSPS